MDKQEREEIKEIIKEETKHLATRDEMQKGFAETHAALEELQKSSAQTQATLLEMQVSLDRQAEMIQGEFKRINKRFDSFEARVSKLEERVTKVEERLGIMSRQLENISDSVAELRAERKHDVLYVTSLEEKMLAERTEAQNEYQTLTAKLNELEARIFKLEGKSNG